MKFSKIISVGALVAAANAAVVYRTVHKHITVTIEPDGQIVTLGLPPTTASPAPEQPEESSISAGADAPASTPEPSSNNVQQYFAEEPSSSTPPPPPTTTSTPPPPPPPPTTSSSSTPPPPPPTTTSVKVQSTTLAVKSSASPSASASVNANNANSDNSNSDYEQECLDAHNTFRSEHSAGALTWNSTLASFAEDYLSNQNCVFAHSGGPYGENIAMGYKTETAAIDAWYNEYKSYDYSAGQFSEDTGHFTQVVWKGTKQLGCATVQCGSSGAFFACEYYPRGNVIGSFQKNVVAN